MTNLQNILVRTDSTTTAYIPYKKKPGVILSPLGRIRRIKRLDEEILEEYKMYLLNNN